MNRTIVAAGLVAVVALVSASAVLVIRQWPAGPAADQTWIAAVVTERNGLQVERDLLQAKPAQARSDLGTQPDWRSEATGRLEDLERYVEGANSQREAGWGRPDFREAGLLGTKQVDFRAGDALVDRQVNTTIDDIIRTLRPVENEAHMAFIYNSVVSVEFQPLPVLMRGAYHPREKKIVLSSDFKMLRPEQGAAYLAHELMHAWQHIVWNNWRSKDACFTNEAGAYVHQAEISRALHAADFDSWIGLELYLLELQRFESANDAMMIRVTNDPTYQQLCPQYGP